MPDHLLKQQQSYLESNNPNLKIPESIIMDSPHYFSIGNNKIYHFVAGRIANVDGTDESEKMDRS